MSSGSLLLQVFISIALILGDGLYNFIKVLLRTIAGFITMVQQNSKSMLPVSDIGSSMSTTEDVSFDEERRTELFLKDQIPKSVAYGGYIAVAAISIGTLPQIFPQLKWYYILVAYVVAPVLAFCNAYGSGLTDWSLASTYGKLAIFVFGAWAGLAHGGVLVGLAACGVMMSIVSTASDLMQDFKTGYLTLASPRSMFVSQVIGTALGCVVNPLVFNVFHHFYESSAAGKGYEAPLAKVYRAIAVLGAGDHELPRHCLAISAALFGLALAVSAVRELAAHNRWPAQHYIPSVTGMAVSFLLVPAVSIDMCVGSLILFAWSRADKEGAQVFAPVFASGLICGDGLFSIPYALLARYDVTPPMCVKFISRVQNKMLDDYISKASR